MNDKSSRSLTGRLFGFLRSAPEPAAAGSAAPASAAAALPRAEDVLAATDVPLLVLHESGVLDGLNPAAERLTGYAADEVVGRRWQVLFPAAVLAELGEAPLAVLLGGGHPGALALRHKSGALVPVTLGVRRGDGAGAAFYVVSAQPAATLEAAPAPADALAAAAFDALPEAALAVDADGRLIAFNAAAETLFGYPRAAAIDQPLIELLVPERFRAAHAAGIARHLAGEVAETPRRMEVMALQADGNEFPAEVTITPIGGGGNAAWCAVVRDLAARRESEELLRAAAERAEAANRAKSDFLATMSHEIRTPMNAVLGTLTLLLDTPLTEEQRNFVETASESGKALLTIINDILDFSKIEAGRLDLENTDFDVVLLVEGVAELLAPRAYGKHIEIGSYVDSSVPRRLGADVGRLRQVLLNLAGNAVKFTRKGGVSIVVTRCGEASPGQARLRFEIADTGIGIPDVAQAQLFERFTQSDPSHSRKYGGTGLGLAISRRLVELMGGSIGFSSQTGIGSIFWFELVCTVADAETVEPAAGTRALGGVRALVVEDNPVSRRLRERELGGWGMTVQSVANGMAALALLRDARTAGQPCDVVLIDQWLADMHGEELGQAIRNDPLLASTGLILMATMGTPSVTARVRKLGFQASLTKPVRQHSLYRWLCVAVGLGDAETLQRNEEAEAAVNAPPAPAAPAAVRARASRLLLVEDSPVNQMVAVAMLKKAGYTVEAVNNGVEAVAAVRGNPYDLVIMDLAMPEMDGFEATSEIRKLPPPTGKIPIVAMTANALPGDRERCLNAGMDDYLTKPIDRAQMLATLEHWLTPADTVPPAAEHAGNGAAGEAEPVLDRGALDQLGADTDAEVLTRVVRLFLEETAHRLDNVDTALARGDWITLQREGHTLKSSAGTFGARQLQTQARQLNEACRANDHVQAAALARSLRAVAQPALDALAALFPPRR
ncbi:PAS domain S-box-containing protein [Plasticicumulans lactativorans]|uniref:Sensory/regulatory protein RpfC n=1 Tax=Plasticicumulans lactativorans TaxID=1133106 RepID=A0A4R2LAB7_9GAMM|nr:response regulator [Plasticicumulans lactativorans]TCO83778.1 PAS domain S-box-containing protein [Plasticicumulans lactativorans]